jgi:hypothetical protein
MFDEWYGPFLKFLLGFACCEGLAFLLCLLGVFLWRLDVYLNKEQKSRGSSDHT